MRNGNTGFNSRAAVVVSSQIYDRRALDGPLLTLPLLTSLQHLAYLTSTSPRIREILTLDGGLERLVTILGRCLDLARPGQGSAKPRQHHRFIPFKPFAAYSNGSTGQDYVDMQVLVHTYGFALQCIVNVGVRGSEQIRTRVVEGGVLPVVARILSGFLAARQKERERRQATLEPSRSITLWRDHNGHIPDQHHSSLVSQQTFEEEELDDGAVTPATVLHPSAASIGIPVMTTTAPTPIASRHNLTSLAALESLLIPAQLPTLPPNASRLPPAHLSINRTNTPDTIASIDEVEGDQQSIQSCGEEHENDAESSGQEIDENEQMDTEEENGSRSSSRSRRGRRATVKLSSIPTSGHHSHSHHHRRAPEPASPMDHSEAPSGTQRSNHSGEESEEQDNDGDVIMLPSQVTTHDSAATPLGQPAQLPHHRPSRSLDEMDMLSSPTARSITAIAAPLNSASVNPSSSSSVEFHFKEEDVLHCLHLLAYLSKYPHVRAIFHDPENEACRPPLPPTPFSSGASLHNIHASSGCARKKQRCGENGEACSSTCTADHAHDQDVMDDDEDSHLPTASGSTSRHSCTRAHTPADLSSFGSLDCCDELAELARAKALASLPAKDRKPALEPSRPPRSTANNVFSLVEQYTFRPSSPSSQIDRSLRLPTDIQYWAGVIMRNACRKDEIRGGIRQCANMGCGVWERFPREFAKCRRCRKAKYCSKGCQRRAWQSGHRYWCSARQDTPPQQPNVVSNAVVAATNEVAVQIATNTAQPGTIENANTTEIRVMDDM